MTVQLSGYLGLLAGALMLTASSMRGQAIPELKFERYTLPNGLEVILHEDHSVPLVAVDTWYKVGSGDELRGRTGFAHLFEHVMFMGSQNVPVGEFDKLLEGAGANNNGSTFRDWTNYYEWMPSNALPLALWLDADRMGWLLPTMDQSKLDVQRDIVKNERREGVDNAPYGLADETIYAALYPASHPYSWDVIGSMADLSAATLDDVKNFFRTYYAPNNATISIAGDFQPDSVKRWITRYFGDIPRGPTLPSRPTVPEFTMTRDTFMVVEDRVQLPRLYNSWHTVRLYHQDDATLDILAYTLAGDKNSRLYKRLVYDLQVAQDVSAVQQSSKLDGDFRITVTPQPAQRPTAIQELVNAEIGRIIRDGITDRELQRAQNSIRTGFLDKLASVVGKAGQLNLYNYFTGSPGYAQEDAARYERVTVADVRRVAERYLAQPRVVLTIVPQGQRNLMVKGGSR
jgi:zinc protease